jgi:hypothetical protein
LVPVATALSRTLSNAHRRMISGIRDRQVASTHVNPRLTLDLAEEVIGHLRGSTGDEIE